MIYGVVMGQDGGRWITAWTISISRRIQVSRFRTPVVVCRVNRQNKTTPKVASIEVKLFLAFKLARYFPAQRWIFT